MPNSFIYSFCSSSDKLLISSSNLTLILIISPSQEKFISFSGSSEFKIYIIGLWVNSPKFFTNNSSSFLTTTFLAACPLFNTLFICSNISFCFAASLSLLLISFIILANFFSIVFISAKINSIVMVSWSLKGLMSPLTWITFWSLKSLTTSQIASHSLIWDKNWFPNPSPSWAPFTKPAISVNSIKVGIILAGLDILAILFNRSSGTFTTPTLGSIVQKG